MLVVSHTCAGQDAVDLQEDLGTHRDVMLFSDESDLPLHLSDHSYSVQVSTCQQCMQKDEQLLKMSTTVQELTQSTNPLRQRGTKLGTDKSDPFIASDAKVKHHTGLPNKATFLSLFHLLKPRAERMRYWHGHKRFHSMSIVRRFRRTPKKSGPTRILSCKDEFTLTLMKLRLGLTNGFLSHIFGLSSGCCSSIINTWIKFLAHELKCLVFWPSKEQIRTYRPPSLRRNYPNLRCTLDCSETFIERPRDLKLQAATWSDYKHHNTLKYLVGISPDGLISFISNSWGGRTTDRYIVQHCGILECIEPYDLVMADRGFTIREDLLFRQADLVIPPTFSRIAAYVQSQRSENQKKSQTQEFMWRGPLIA